MSHKYNITYKVNHHPDGLTKEQLNEMGDDELGACDNIILISLMGTPGKKENLSTMFVSRTSDDDELDANQMFTIWSVWTAALAGDETLSPGRRAMCQSVLDAIRQAMGITPKKPL